MKIFLFLTKKPTLINQWYEQVLAESSSWRIYWRLQVLNSMLKRSPSISTDNPCHIPTDTQTRWLNYAYFHIRAARTPRAHGLIIRVLPPSLLPDVRRTNVVQCVEIWSCSRAFVFLFWNDRRKYMNSLYTPKFEFTSCELSSFQVRKPTFTSYSASNSSHTLV